MSSFFILFCFVFMLIFLFSVFLVGPTARGGVLNEREGRVQLFSNHDFALFFQSFIVD